MNINRTETLGTCSVRRIQTKQKLWLGLTSALTLTTFIIYFTFEYFKWVTSQYEKAIHNGSSLQKKILVLTFDGILNVFISFNSSMILHIWPNLENQGFQQSLKSWIVVKNNYIMWTLTYRVFAYFVPHVPPVINMLWLVLKAFFNIIAMEILWYTRLFSETSMEFV